MRAARDRAGARAGQLRPVARRLARACPAAALACALLAPGPAGGVTFWDADFNAQPLGPLRYVTNPDGPPDLPTFLRGGTNQVAYDVVMASGDLVDQPLEVVEGPTSGIPRATFSLAQADGLAPLESGRARVELDLLVGACALTEIGQMVSERCYQVVVLGSPSGTDTAGEAAIVWDCAGGVCDGGDGVIRLAAPGARPSLPFALDVATRVRIEVDLAAPQPSFEAFADGVSLGSAPLSTFRFDGIAVASGAFTDTGRVAFDDVRIATVPEPGRGALAAAGLAVALALGARRLHSASAPSAAESSASPSRRTL